LNIDISIYFPIRLIHSHVLGVDFFYIYLTNPNAIEHKWRPLEINRNIDLKEKRNAFFLNVLF
jgi:hypothetical protein